MAAYLANFDFDRRLAGRGGGSQPRPGPPDENAVLWRLMAGDGDEILVPGLREPFDAPAVGPLSAVHFRPPRMTGEGEFIPWGVDELAARIANGRISAAEVALVEQLNNRRFAFEVEPVPEAFFTTDPERVLSLAEAGERIMMKPRHGGFGCGLRRVLGVETDDNLRGWVHARCREGGLIVEPLLTIEREWGLHWDVTEHDTHCLGRTELVCDDHGQFQRTDATSAHQHQEHETLHDTIRSSGYVGPLTLDQSINLTPSGSAEPILRRYQDINARWSVGRLAWQLAERLCEAAVSVRRRPPTADTTDPEWIPIPTIGDGAPRWEMSVRPMS